MSQENKDYSSMVRKGFGFDSINSESQRGMKMYHQSSGWDGKNMVLRPSGPEFE